MTSSSVYQSIKKRRSVRIFSKRRIESHCIKRIIDAGRWAPSGLNNQPWRFVVVQEKTMKDSIAQCTEYSPTIRRSDYVILIFLDRQSSYHRLKDAQAIGACIQNMLLCALELGIGTCWMGEILNHKQKVNKLLSLTARYELMAAIALGYAQKKRSSKRSALKRLILKEYR